MEGTLALHIVVDLAPEALPMACAAVRALVHGTCPPSLAITLLGASPSNGMAAEMEYENIRTHVQCNRHNLEAILDEIGFNQSPSSLIEALAVAVHSIEKVRAENDASNHSAHD